MNNLEDKITVLYENKPCYDILYRNGFKDLNTVLMDLNLKNRKVCIVTDSNVEREYSELLMNQIASDVKETYVFSFPYGEVNKNLDTVHNLYEFLIGKAFDRNDVLIALGGGVVGDLTGFTAATYLRGIRFIQIPTTLLSMVDSSIGGKTGVDFHSYKNMVGAFYMPKSVYMNISSLQTLKEAEYFSGMGEIIKHGLIKDIDYYHWLKQNIEGIKKKDYTVLCSMIKRSCEIKKEVVEKDPKEQGERALLNFGHTIGHAVEKLMGLKLLHGECVSIGIVAASYISMKRGYILSEEFTDIKNTLLDFHLPIHIEELDIEEILETITRDKKMDAGKIKFILLRSMGDAFIDTTVTKEEMLEAVEYLMIRK